MRKLPIVIYFNNTRVLLLLILALIFVFGAIYINEDNDWKILLVIGFFGLCAGVFLFCLLNYSSYYLKITEQGFETKTMLKSNFFTWDDVDYFSIISFNFNKQIVFRLTELYHQKRKTGELRKFISGNFGGISSLYDMNSKELVALLNECKLKYSKKTS